MSWEDSSVQLLTQIARALVDLDTLDGLGSFRLPYPASAQRALDQLVLRCLEEGACPPRGVPQLIKWSHERPVDEWPLSVPEGAFADTSVLLDAELGVLTELCLELAVANEYGDLPDSAFTPIQAVEARCLGNDEGRYAAFRTFLTRNPVRSNEDLNELVWNKDLGEIDDVIRQHYTKVRPAVSLSWSVPLCGECGNLISGAGAGEPRCAREECRLLDTAPGLRPYHGESDTYYQLDRYLRHFVAGPGRTVLRLLEELRALGGRAEVWPDRGACDVRLRCPGGTTWDIRVLDRSSPAVLAYAMRNIKKPLAGDRSLWLIPDYRIAADPGYIETFECFRSTTDLALVSERQLLDDVRGHM